jgi:transposase
MFVEPILDRLRPVKGTGRGRPRRRPAKLHADRAYDNRRVRRYLRNRGITARRTVGWLLTFRRLALRYDRSEATITALATLAAAMICIRRLTPNKY